MINKLPILNLIGIVAGFSVALVAIYAWLLPTFFNGYPTYSFLIAGICGTALCAGRSCMKARINPKKQDETLVPFALELLLAVIVALFSSVLVFILSMVIIVNYRGV